MQFHILISNVFGHNKDGEPLFQAVSATSYSLEIVGFQIELCCELKKYFWSMETLIFPSSLWFVAGGDLQDH